MTRKIASLAAVAALAVGSYKLGAAVFGEAASAPRLHNQVWIERLPTDDRDMIHHLVLIDDEGERFGAFGKSSQWRHFIELFRWAREDARLTMLLPQERKRLDLGVKVWECAGEAPAPFQLCLELSNKRQTMKYYSRHDWSLDSAESVAALKTAYPELTQVLELPASTKASALDAAEFDVVDEPFAE
ncbi:MAG: hypothetical protein H0T76_24390 [Nannocystis sp.]|nr:hypothetical protein [Nannocystis sp.]MBA3549629.1 hypothetical protein [Nannocystis sp.]